MITLLAAIVAFGTITVSEVFLNENTTLIDMIVLFEVLYISFTLARKSE